MKTIILPFLLFIAFNQKGQTQKLDVSAYDSMIQKLESASHIDDSDTMVLQVPLIHRLADLYAERARVLSLEKEGLGNQIYADQIRADRQKSLKALQLILPQLNKNEKGPTQLQAAYLHERLGEDQKALLIYQKIASIPVGYDGKTLALVYIKLGDEAFHAGQNEKAQGHFEKARQIKANPRLAYTLFRLAWIQYNQGQTLLAEKNLFQLLNKPALFNADESFRQDVLHDLSTFMSHNDISATTLKAFVRLNPKNSLQKNLMTLATELDRNAKKNSALKVWALVGKQNLKFEDQIDRQVQITRIEYDLGHDQNVVLEIHRSAQLIKDSRCEGNADCNVAQQNLRRIITDWAKAEQRKPSAGLILAFNEYTKNFDDFEMCYIAAQTAQVRGQYADTFYFYDQAAGLLHKIQKRTPDQQKMFEGSLVGSIEVAEHSKNKELQRTAYLRYLEFNPNGDQRDEVRYQIARWSYEKNDYPTARREFLNLALDPKIKNSIREKAADLALDTSVLLKDQNVIEADALMIAQNFPNRKTEALQVWRKAVLNQTAQILNTASTEDVLQKEFKKLESVSAQNFSSDQKVQLLKNKIELAFRLKNIEALSNYAHQLLKVQNLGFEDREKALSHLAWSAEVRMQFTEALNSLSKMKGPMTQKPAFLFKIALMKELAGQNPKAQYQKFLSSSGNATQKAYAAHQLVLLSKNPEDEFKSYSAILSKNAELDKSAGLYAFEKRRNETFGLALTSRKNFKGSEEAAFIRHDIAFKKMKSLKNEFAAIRLAKKSDHALKKAILQRNQLIKKFEKLANQAIQQKDSFLQVMYLPQLALEKRRLGQDIKALPTPRGLKPAEKADYRGQVDQMVSPYLTESEAIDQKNAALWQQLIENNSFQNLSDWALQTSKPGAVLAAQELSLLKASARLSGLPTAVFEKLSEQRQKVSASSSELNSLKELIRKDPFNFDNLEKMKSLQSRLGRGPMVAYLDHRLNEIAKGGKN